MNEQELQGTDFCRRELQKNLDALADLTKEMLPEVAAAVRDLSMAMRANVAYLAFCAHTDGKKETEYELSMLITNTGPGTETIGKYLSLRIDRQQIVLARIRMPDFAQMQEPQQQSTLKQLIDRLHSEQEMCKFD